MVREMPNLTADLIFSLFLFHRIEHQKKALNELKPIFFYLFFRAIRTFYKFLFFGLVQLIYGLNSL